MTGFDCKAHWEGVYTSKAETGVSWFQNEPRLSLELIGAVAPAQGARVIDVGGGASVLVDRLLDGPFEQITVVDISETALDKAKSRLGRRAGQVRWIVADVTEVGDVGVFDIWHDRAVFHFLTDLGDRMTYVELARRTLPAGGHLILATFANNGPTECSGRAVRRYDAASMGTELGDDFTLVKEAHESHTTPSGSSQAFFYGVFKRR